MAGDSFYDVITAAINDLTEHGFDSVARLAHWEKQIREAAERTMAPPYRMEQMLREAMISVYKKLVEQGGITKLHPGVARFTLEKVRPQLRAELDRRILASAQLIRLNRQASIEKTLQRFSGWATSIPKGGSDNVDKRDTKTDIRKAMAQLPFEERRVIVDQSHKLTSSISEVLAKDGGAIAVWWNSHYKQQNYDYRDDHKDRDILTHQSGPYLLRDSWAQQQGLVKPGKAGYYDDVTAFGEEIFCRCFGQFCYSLRALPESMLTAKGKAALAEAKAKVREMMA